MKSLIVLIICVATAVVNAKSITLVDAPQFGKWYFVGSGQQSLNDSKSFCTSHHGELVRIDSLAEEMFVRRLVNIKYSSKPVGVNAIKINGSYVWPNGDAIQVSNWWPGNPKCRSGCCRVYLGGHNGWVDTQCYESIHFVCEIVRKNVTNDEVGCQNSNSSFVNETRDWVYYLNVNYYSNYFLTDYEVSLKDAKNFCEENEAHLAVIESQWEKEEIRYVIGTKKVWIGLEKVNLIFKWLGKYDLEYENWNSDAVLYSLEELNVMENEIPEDMNRTSLLKYKADVVINQSYYKNKFGDRSVKCMGVVLEPDGFWNTEDCSKSNLFFGVCEKKTSKKTRMSRLEDQVANLKDQLTAIREKLSN